MAKISKSTLSHLIQHHIADFALSSDVADVLDQFSKVSSDIANVVCYLYPLIALSISFNIVAMFVQPFLQRRTRPLHNVNECNTVHVSTTKHYIAFPCHS